MTDQAVTTGMEPINSSHPTGAQGNRRSNWRTALVLLSIVLVFFLGVIVNRLLFG